MDTRKKDRYWNQLISIINKGNVVPIIGEDLLELPDQGYLYNALAKRYADYSDIEYDDTTTPLLSNIVTSHPDFNSNPHDIYQEVGEEYELWQPDIPNALQELAKITDFNLFVSTTFDDLLERAINQVRFGGNKRTIVIPYSPKNIPADTQIDNAISSGRPVIIQLFGHFKNPLEFALTEGDKVEYMHALQSVEYSPKRIFNELHERPLLLLGNKFPDWLYRSFLRMTRRSSLDSKDIPKQIFADSEIIGDPVLKLFLERFTSNKSLIDDQSPVDFTLSLSNKWQEKSNNSTNNDSTLSQEIQNKPMPRNAVFISYSASNEDGSTSYDRTIALKLRNALEDSGVTAWLDIDQLQGGDQYERKIKKYISTCSVFLPIISNSTNARQDAFFRKEWSWALDRLLQFTGSDRQFIIPIALNEIDPYKAVVPEEFTKFQFMNIDNEEFDIEHINYIKSIYLNTLNSENKLINTA